MFGANKLTKANYTFDRIVVNSIFYTIQGEGPFTGHPAVFCRLTGCNLKCWFCDTDFAAGDESDPYILFQTLATTARQKNCDLIVITGGEPMIQPIGQLCDLLIDDGFRVQIETSGSVCAPGLPWGRPGFTVVCSPKTPNVCIDMVNAHAWKYVVRVGGISDDGLPNTSYQVRGKDSKLARPLNGSPVYITPMDEYNTDRDRANRSLAKKICLKYGYRISLQIHKIIGVE